METRPVRDDLEEGFEPFRAKVVEPIPRPTRAEREEALARADWNLFRLPAAKVTIDLLTDSGVCAMSSAQWSASLGAAEAYAGSSSFERFQASVREMTGFSEVLPTHQGRGAEKVLFGLLAGPGKIVPGNTHFDTTRAHIEHAGAQAVDLPVAEAADPSSTHPFKGNLDVDALDRLLDREGANRVPLVVVTVTSNSVGGHPVSLANLRDVRAACDRHGVLLFLDAARHAENAFLARERDSSLAAAPVAAVARAYFDLADGCAFSAKKDGLVNTGGFLAFRSSTLAEKARRLLVLLEGFPTYGGLAARDLDAMAVGLREALDERYLAHRIGQVRRFAERVRSHDIPCMRPPGGHAVFVDAGAFLPHVDPGAFPGQALACALYLEGGVRSVEVGSLMCPPEPGGVRRPELLRLAVPRRVYSDAHLRYVADTLGRLLERRGEIDGLRIVEASPFLRHFTARLAPLPAEARRVPEPAAPRAPSVPGRLRAVGSIGRG